jgi:hypothetical protein
MMEGIGFVRNRRRGRVVATAVVASCVLAAAFAGTGSGTAARAGVDRGALEAYARLPLSFVPNRGQTDRRVAFMASGAGYRAFLTRSGAVLALQNGSHGSAVRLDFLNAGGGPLVGTGALPGRASFLLGNRRSSGLGGLPTFSKVLQRGTWPGVDVAWHGSQTRLEYDFTLAPGAGAKAIRLRFAGVSRLSLDRAGDLRLRLADGGVLTQPAAVAFQRVRSRRVAVPARYVIGAGQSVSLALGAHDSSRPVVIDPGLVYSSYLGGGGGEAGQAIAVDGAGDAYATGIALSSDFPTTAGAYQTTSHGIFVSKLNADGSSLLYSTYLGGSQSEYSTGIALDGTGDAYVTGATASPDFPTTPGALQPTLQNATPFGISNAFVSKLNADGSALVYSTYLGGTDNFDTASAIAVDASGDAYLTGTAQSSDFPTTDGAFQTRLKGTSNAFVSKLNATGSALVYSTFLGGSTNKIGNSASDVGNGIAVDQSGDAYVTGRALSTDFPTTPGAFRTTLPGLVSGFVTKLNPDGSGLAYSTYLGGSLEESGNAIAVDDGGDAYVTGLAASSDFPTSPGAFQTSLGGGGGGSSLNAFVTKLNAGGSGLVYSTYLGGAHNDTGGDVNDTGKGIAVDGAGEAYVTGQAQSSDFPTTPGAFQTQFAGGVGDAFVTKLNAGGTALAYSTYLGGGENDDARAIALDAAGDAFITGVAVSADFPTTPGAFQTSRHGSSDAFVVKLGLGEAATALSYIGPISGQYGTPVTLTARLTSGGTGLAAKTVSIGFGAESCQATTDATGTASCSVTPLDAPAGSPYGITASFAGAEGYRTSSDTSKSFSVQKASTMATLASSANPSTVGQQVTYTVTVSRGSAGSGSPTGTVAFSDGTTTISGCANVGLSSGKATCQATYQTTAGSPHHITASYSGDANFGVSSAALTQTVGPAATTLVAAAAKRTLLSVTFSATLTRTSGGAPVSGKTITFSVKGQSVCHATTNSSGVASCVVAPTLLIIIGPASYTATFAGDSEYLKSSGTGRL